jgi:hypothetical protein
VLAVDVVEHLLRHSRVQPGGGAGPGDSDRAPVRFGRGAGEVAVREGVKQLGGGTTDGRGGRQKEEGEIPGPTGVNWSFYRSI